VHDLEELVAEPGEPRRRLGTCRDLVSHALTLSFFVPPRHHRGR
jgi:hypothetical protein